MRSLDSVRSLDGRSGLDSFGRLAAVRSLDGFEGGRGGRLGGLEDRGSGGLGGLVDGCNADGLLGRLFSDRGRCLGLRRGPAR